MNIFVLDRNPKRAAQFLCDIHVRKMLVESAQMLANAYPPTMLADEECPRTQKGTVRKHSYPHHPCSKWTLECFGNWSWLLKHAQELCKQFKFRQHKNHFTEDFIHWCYLHVPTWLPNYPNFDTTPFAVAIKDKNYICDDIVESYRRYYIGEKTFAKWTNVEVPDWYKGENNEKNCL